MRFEWNAGKALELKKHRIPFERAQEVFDDPRAVPYEDLEHSRPDETRYVMIGMSTIGLLFVSFTYRGDVVRLISARRQKSGW